MNEKQRNIELKNICKIDERKKKGSRERKEHTQRKKEHNIER